MNKLSEYYSGAYEAGAQQALVDLGFVKRAEPVINTSFGPPPQQVFKADVSALPKNPLASSPAKVTTKSPVSGLVSSFRNSPVSVSDLFKKQLTIKGRF